MIGEPPDTIYADYLASNGKVAIAYMLRRLQEDKREYAKADLIRAFREMHRSYYNLHNEPEVIESLKRTSEIIKDTYWRKQSENYIEDIIREPGVSDSK
jgi:hypothetical protein